MSSEGETDPSMPQDKVVCLSNNNDDSNNSSARTIKQDVRLIWHRRDLRLHDNPLYSSTSSSTGDNAPTTETNNSKYDNNTTPSLSVYIFDDKQFTPRPSTCKPKKWNAVTTGPHAARLLIEAVADLRQSIRGKGGELLVRSGNPVQILPDLVRQVGATELLWCEEPGIYEEKLSKAVREEFIMSSDDALSKARIATNVGYTLYHPDDLPRSAEQWAALAHPKQNGGKKKRKKQKQKKGKPSSSSFSTKNIPATTTTTTTQKKDEYDDFFNFMSKHSIVDVSPERLVGMPRIMGDYRRAARTHTAVRSCLSTLDRFVLPSNIQNVQSGDIPTLEQLTKLLFVKEKDVGGLKDQRLILGMSKETIQIVVDAALARSRIGDEHGNCEIDRGGETSALERLNHFIGGGRAVVADRSAADVSGDGSSKFSVHLALGTISPRLIYKTALDAGEGSKWLISHLEMRDFFLYNAFASGSKLFCKDGMPVAKKKEKIEWYDPSQNENISKKWIKWATGETGLPLVDAGQKEMIQTGYCSNRVRQNMASVLTKDLLIDWRAGAEWFQFCLEDHCVGANWGNWAYFSGVGSDPKSRHFRTVSQAMRYDPRGKYVRKWLPGLQGVDADNKNDETVFRPWDLVDGWCEPIVDPKTQYTWHDMQRLQELGQLAEIER